MSYTPHEWTDGETITAAKMNALETGVANAGGNVFPLLHFTAIDASASGNYGVFVLATFANNCYTVVDNTASWWGIFHPSGSSETYVSTGYPVPTLSGLYLVFVNYEDSATVTETGGATGPVDVDYNGSTYSGYVLTADAELTFEWS